MGNLRKYKELALFLWKYGNSDLVKNAGLNDSLANEFSNQDQQDEVTPQDMVKDLQEMGPAYIKLGQMLSTRPDLLPSKYIEALTSLQDEVDPFPYEDIEEIIQEELGIRISKAFNWFDKEPLASASLGQAHLAELRNGETVVVKVQRPNIRKQVLEELKVLEKTTNFLEENTDFGKRYGVNKLFKQFKRTLIRELNYLKEAEHIKLLDKNLAEFKHIVMPVPIDDYTTDKVLTMKYLKGKKITKVSSLKKLEFDGHALADELFKAYLKQIVIDGFLHADPHPGNVHLMDNDKIALLDFGMVAHISQDIKDNYLKLLLNLGNGEASEVANILIELSDELEDCDEDKFRSELSTLIMENRHATMNELQTGKVFMFMIQAAGESGFLLPVEMSLIGKALLNLDQVGRSLAPDFDPNDSIQRHSMDLMNQHMIKDLTSPHLMSALLESKKLVEKLPERVNKFTSNLAENKIKIEVDALDEKHLMEGFQKIANRITAGLILAALIVGSALLMQVKTEFTLLGYPGLAMIFFLIAVLGAGYLGFKTFLTDEDSN